MDKNDLGHVLATQLIECIANSKYGYMSSTSPGFSHLTDAGKEVMLELINGMTGTAQKIHEENIKNKAEALMVDRLRK